MFSPFSVVLIHSLIHEEKIGFLSFFARENEKEKKEGWLWHFRCRTNLKINAFSAISFSFYFIVFFQPVLPLAIPFSWTKGKREAKKHSIFIADNEKKVVCSAFFFSGWAQIGERGKGNGNKFLTRHLILRKSFANFSIQQRFRKKTPRLTINVGMI